MSRLSVLLASWPDEDDLVAEIWLGDQYVADVKADGDVFVVTLWSTEAVQVELDDLKQALDAACQRLRRHDEGRPNAARGGSSSGTPSNERPEA